MAVTSLDKTVSAEMVAEVADLLLRHDKISTVFVGGLVGTTYHMYVRTEVGGVAAWRLLKSVLKDEGSFGGHGAVAPEHLIHRPVGHQAPAVQQQGAPRHRCHAIEVGGRQQHRLTQAQYPLERWPRFRAWYEKVAARPAFDRAVVSWRP